MTSSAPSSPKHRVCRLVRAPTAVVAVVLLYATFLFAFREGDHAVGFTALRGGAPSEGSTTLPGDDGEETAEAREEVETWDPVPDHNYSERGPVKGGVEVYPLQVKSKNHSRR